MILPELFVRRMKEMLNTEFDQFQHSFDQEITTTIRVNPAKFLEKPSLTSVNYCNTGYIVPKRPVFTIDPFIHSGVYYVQESSSMFLEQAINQTISKSALKVLDLCAAPGGKSTHLASLLPNDSLLVSNDVIRSRGQILSENLKKWGSPNVIVTNNDPQDFQRLPGFFDILVVDAPCSGEGLFRRDENAVNEWSPENTRLCAQRQQRILADVWPTLREGGLLIYSTCTFNPAENEENIKWLNEFATIAPVSLKTDESWGITITDAGGFPCYRFYPHKVSGEGFFMAVVRKTGGSESSQCKKIKDNQLLASKGEKEMGRRYFSDGIAMVEKSPTEMKISHGYSMRPLKNKLYTHENLDVLRFEDSLLAFPAPWLSDLLQIKNNLRIIHAGVKIGEIKQKDLLPAHELALSTILNRSVFPEIDLTIEEAITYLKRDDISPQSDERGWNLMTYRNIPLGWAKNLGNRFNSAFPKEWRIRMSVTDFQGERLRTEMARFPL